MRSVSEMTIAIIVSLIILSAIYAVRDAFLATELTSPTMPEGPIVTSPPPHEVNIAPRSKTASTPPAPLAQPAVASAPLPSPPAPDLATFSRAVGEARAAPKEGGNR